MNCYFLIRNLHILEVDCLVLTLRNNREQFGLGVKTRRKQLNRDGSRAGIFPIPPVDAAEWRRKAAVPLLNACFVVLGVALIRAVGAGVRFAVELVLYLSSALPRVDEIRSFADLVLEFNLAADR